MKRPLRSALNVAAALSSVLIVVVCVLWLRDGRARESVEWCGSDIQRGNYREQSVWAVTSSQGKIHFFRGVTRVKPWEDLLRPGWYYESSAAYSSLRLLDHRPHHFDRIGLGVGYVGDGFSYGVEALVPNWIISLVLGPLPAVRFAKVWRSRRRFKSGLCASCRYDLRATPGRCPECGAVPGAAKPR